MKPGWLKSGHEMANELDLFFQYTSLVISHPITLAILGYTVVVHCLFEKRFPQVDWAAPERIIGN